MRQHRRVASGKITATVAALALVASACSSTSAEPEYGQECATFAPDPENPFFPVNETFVDPDPLRWPTVDPTEVDLHPAVLEQTADAVALSPVSASLLVVRHGQLAFERYFNGFDQADANNVHSLVKSIQGVLTGIAIDEGHVDLQTSIGEVLPQSLAGDHGEVTVENLLTMAGGVETPQPEWAYEWEPGDGRSLVRAALERPSVAAPGPEFTYSTGMTHVLGAVLAEATGESLCDYAARRLFGPLGIDVERWHVDLDGYFGGLFLTPREVARFGQLVLDNGVFDGERLVSSSWLEASLSTHWDLGCIANPALAERYGYLWWGYEIGGHDVWMASGLGAQDLAIIDDLDLVALITHNTETTTSGAMRVPMPALLHDLLLGAVVGEPQPAPSEECLADVLSMASVAADGSSAPAPIPGLPPNVVGPLSPDGGRLAFAKPFAGAWDLYALSRDATDQLRVTHDAAQDAMPAWSPDATMLAFARGEPAQSDLYLVAADGSSLDQLTDLDGWENAPTWSPDGTRIGFIRGGDDVNGWGHPGELWVINPDGTGLSLLRAEDTSNPAWSPDGTRITFDNITGDGHVGLLDLATGAVTDLGEGFFPRWSPDGTRLVFGVLDPAGGSDIYTMDADGTNRIRLTDDPAFDTAPQWSPDGATILYGSRPAEPGE